MAIPVHANVLFHTGALFIKGLILSFSIQNILNFVADVSVKFSVLKIHIIIAAKSVFLSEFTKHDVSWGFVPDPIGVAYSAAQIF